MFLRTVNLDVSRRRFIDAALAAGAASAFPPLALGAQPARKRLVARTRVIDVNGKSARVFALVGPDGKSGIRLEPGERFQVELMNETGGRTIVHWHGQLPPWTQDGFPWPQTPPLQAGALRSYDYVPIPGTYWMHSHQGLQEQNLMTAPLIVRDAAAVSEDRQEVVLMLHDFSFRAPQEILASLTGGSGMNMPGMSMSGMDLNDVDYDAFLANDRTLADPEVVSVERGSRVRLRVINGASSSQFWIDLGELTGRVVAVDGHAVYPVAAARFPIAMAQRLDVLIDLPSSGAFPILARLEGSPRQTGIILATKGASIARVGGESHQPAPPVDDSLERRLTAVEPLASRPTDLARTMILDGSMKPYAWSIDGQHWPNVKPLMLRNGQRVEISLVNQSGMAHPMHLHGHAFQVVALSGRRIHGAVRDTVIVPPMTSVRIAFDANNPGRWAFHCHNLYHMATGMMTEFRYDGLAV